MVRLYTQAHRVGLTHSMEGTRGSGYGALLYEGALIWLHCLAALAELGYLSSLVAGHGGTLAVLLLTGLSCKCALSWLLLHYLFFSAWPVTHLSYPAGPRPAGDETPPACPLAVLLLTGLSCKCALSWLLLHYLFFSAWPVTHLSYPAGTGR